MRIGDLIGELIVATTVVVGYWRTQRKLKVPKKDGEGHDTTETRSIGEAVDVLESEFAGFVARFERLTEEVRELKQAQNRRRREFGRE